MKKRELTLLGSTLLASVASVTLVDCGFVQAATPINSARPAAAHIAAHRPKAKPRPRKIGPPTAIPTPGWTWQLGAKNRVANIAANWALAWLQKKNWNAVSATSAPGTLNAVKQAWMNGVATIAKDSGTNHVIWQPVAIAVANYGPGSPSRFIIQLYVRSVNQAGHPTLAKGLAVSNINYGGNQVGWNSTIGVKAPNEYAIFTADITIAHPTWKRAVQGWDPTFMLTPVGATLTTVHANEQAGWQSMGKAQGSAIYH